MTDTGGFDFDQHFARPITAECMFCHSNRAFEVEHTVNGFRPPIFAGYAIGCERCHGPGELHVRRHERAEDYAGLDETIVNPRNLAPELREAVILRDLQDMDYREIAQVLKVPEGTVKSRINRGRTELARLLSRNYRQVN